MSRSTKGVYEHPKGSGIWWVEWYDNRGKRHRQPVGKKSSANAYKAKVTALLKDIKRNLRPESALYSEGFLKDREAQRLTLGEYFKDCEAEYKQQNTWNMTRTYMKNWDKLIGDLYLDEITAKHAVKRRTARLEKGLAPATVNREIEFLRSVLNRAVRDGQLSENPLAKLKDLPEHNKRKRTLLLSEEALLKGYLAHEDFEIIAFAVDTGIRRGRLFALPWHCVDLEGEWIEIRGAKAGSDRSLPMTRRVKAILERRKAERTGLWVFGNSTNTNHLDPTNFVNRVFKPACKVLGIEDLTFHDLRRTFASRMATAGKGGRVLSDLMGHSSSATTDRYAHLDPETFRAAIKVLD